MVALRSKFFGGLLDRQFWSDLFVVPVLGGKSPPWPVLRTQKDEIDGRRKGATICVVEGLTILQRKTAVKLGNYTDVCNISDLDANHSSNRAFSAISLQELIVNGNYRCDHAATKL